MTTFFSSVIYNLLMSFGVIVGASIFAGIGALINNHPPLKTMIDIGGSIKIWAVAIALGGTFSSFEILDDGLFKGELKSIVKQVALVLVALLGANLGCSFIKMIERCGDTWLR